ncbi:hypothetical protein MNBD_GAMMA01-1781 [hydrothermal vent metagenome]|uniref:DUF4139 domain-containing protein n=1 Tax=hydrothermal vent metagenome TaxID=652676 RepID=A0A3B0UX68_9ZZZZ
MQILLKTTLTVLMLMTATQISADDTAITVYSTAAAGSISPQQFQSPSANIPGYAMVKQDRIIDIKNGQFELRFADVTSQIDPTTVSFTTPNNPGAAYVLDQNYQFDIVSTEKLLAKYVGQQVIVEHTSGGKNKTINGRLLGTNGGIIIQESNGSVITLSGYDSVAFPSLPGGLLTKPTLLWLLKGKKSGEELARVTYQTQGMTWWADYNLTLTEDGNQCRMDLSSWVSLLNQAGSSFKNTKLKLIAGEVNRVQPTPPRMRVEKSQRLSSIAEADTGFQEKSLFEYHLYTLPRRVDLPNNSTKQIELFPTVNSVECSKDLVFNGSQIFNHHYYSPITASNYLRSAKPKVKAFISFINSKDKGLGIPLPAGRIRVSQLDEADNSLEFIGEDIIDHTPRNETITIELGNSFDVVGQRKQTNIIVGKKEITETFEIKIRNQKETTTKVKVVEPLYRWSNWKVTSSSEKYTKQNSSTIDFEVKLKPEEEKVITYTVHYWWK